MSRIIVWLFAGAAMLAAQSLRDLADQRGIHVGAAVNPAHFSETDYAGTLAREFNQVEPENVMKFGPIQPGPTTYNFGPPDAIVSFAESHKMAVRGHTLVWHNQNPAWLTNGNFTADQLSAVLHDHISTVVGHYAGKVYAWDVVNEAFNDNGTIRSTIWSDSPGIGLSGTAYIEQAFRWAHIADPKALLFYNDFNDEPVNMKSDAIFKMLQDFKARGVPIDGVGMQMHFTTTPPSITGIESNIKRITALGLQVQITELDVRLPVDSSGQATSAQLATQAQVYRDIVSVCLKYRLCTAIQTWGFTDKYSWIPGTYPGMGAALEFDRSYQPKPNYNSMLSALQTSPPVIRGDAVANSASYANDSVCPGEIVVLFGATFGPASLVLPDLDQSNKLPTQLAGTRLLFDGQPAPVLYAQVGQMSAIVPFAVAGQETTQVEYEYQGVRSNAVMLKVAAAQPGIYTLDSSGTGDAVILDVSYRVIAQNNPARRGGVILLFATGGGVTTPASADGQVLLAAPLPTVAGRASAKIGGVDCPVLYAGSAVDLVAGAVQFNIQVAPGVPSGQQPIEIAVDEIGSQSSAAVWVE